MRLLPRKLLVGSTHNWWDVLYCTVVVYVQPDMFYDYAPCPVVKGNSDIINGKVRV